MNIPIANHDEVYLYLQTLPVRKDLFIRLSAVLNPEEQQRATRYYFDRDRKSFVVTRGLLRYVLSAYLNKAAEEFIFSYGPQGKPFIENTTLQWNVSHSGDRILIGVGHHHPLGVDIEHMTRTMEINEIAARFFTSNESRLIQTLQGEAQKRAFFNVWTRKEALLKAIGSGLSLSLKAYEVSVGNEAVSTVLACNTPSFDSHNWQLHSCAFTDDYLAAAAVHKDLKVVWLSINNNKEEYLT